MATPSDHIRVAHMPRTGRRRSQSVMIPNSDFGATTRVHSLRRKVFLAQLQKERLKYQNDHTEVNEEELPNDDANVDADDYDDIDDGSQHSGDNDKKDPHRMPVSRLAKPKTATGNSARWKSASVTRVKKDTAPMPFKTMHSLDYDNANDNVSHTSEMPPVDITASFRSLNLTELSKKGSNASTRSQNQDPSFTYKESFLGSSQSSLNGFTTSSTNLITKSEVSDQEYFIKDIKDNKGGAQKNAASQPNNTTQISIHEKIKTGWLGKIPYANTGTSCMTAFIGILLGIIGIAFGLASLVLVLLLKSTVDSSLANSTSSSSGGSSTLSTGCSSYTTIDDPTRNVFATGYALGCDNTAPFINRTYPVWIRFTGTGGSTLPLTTPGMNICGSEGTGWYDGTMPSSSGQVVNGTACFTWYNSICRFSVSIMVAHCGSFYTYYLPPPPACMIRYCTI